jgi:hypothetical protein
MSEFEDTSGQPMRRCPYCNYAYQPEAEDYSEDQREEECNGCGKHYYAKDVFTVYHVASPDCALNGQPHEWKDIDLRNGRTHPFCFQCGKCKPIDSK